MSELWYSEIRPIIDIQCAIYMCEKEDTENLKRGGACKLILQDQRVIQEKQYGRLDSLTYAECRWKQTWESSLLNVKWVLMKR